MDQKAADNKDQHQPQQKAPRDQYHKLSSKEIYRTLAFQYRQMGVLGIKTSILTEVVANLFYPNDLDKNAKDKFKKSIEDIFKKYSFKDEINEEDFCKLLDTVEKNVTDETSEAFLVKIFKRHDKDKDGLLNKEEFTQLLKISPEVQGITDKEAEDIFMSLATGQGDRMGVDKKAYLKYCSFQKEQQ